MLNKLASLCSEFGVTDTKEKLENLQKVKFNEIFMHFVVLQCLLINAHQSFSTWNMLKKW